MTTTALTNALESASWWHVEIPEPSPRLCDLDDAALARHHLVAVTSRFEQSREMLPLINAEIIRRAIEDPNRDLARLTDADLHAEIERLRPLRSKRAVERFGRAFDEAASRAADRRSPAITADPFKGLPR